MVFINDTDHGGTTQNAIFTTSVAPCSMIAATRSERDTMDAFCQVGWVYYYKSSSQNPDGCKTYIDTDIGNVIFDGSNDITLVNAYPGWDFTMPFKAVVITNLYY